MMSRSLRIHQFGDASVLRIENVEIGEPEVFALDLTVRGLALTALTALTRDDAKLAALKRFVSEGLEGSSHV